MKPIEFIHKDNLVYFSFYRQNMLYYTIKKLDSIEWFQFPIPTEDLAGATVDREEKSVLMMRYIRKALEDGTMIKVLV